MPPILGSLSRRAIRLRHRLARSSSPAPAPSSIIPDAATLATATTQVSVTYVLPSDPSAGRLLLGSLGLIQFVLYINLLDRYDDGRSLSWMMNR